MKLVDVRLTPFLGQISALRLALLSGMLKRAAASYFGLATLSISLHIVGSVLADPLSMSTTAQLIS